MDAEDSKLNDDLLLHTLNSKEETEDEIQEEVKDEIKENSAEDDAESGEENTDQNIERRSIDYSEDNNLGVCPECGAPLRLYQTRRGLFVGCSAYPVCRYMSAKPVQQQVKIERIIEGSACPECGCQLAVKSGRYGLFIGCTNYPDCLYVYKDTEEKIPCPACGMGYIKQRKTKFNKVFWSCSRYPECKFHLNSHPVQKKCPVCGFPIMVEKAGRSGKYLKCLKCGKRLMLNQQN